MSAPSPSFPSRLSDQYENPLITYQLIGMWRQAYRRHPFLYLLALVTSALFYVFFLLMELRYPQSIETVHLDFLLLVIVVLVVPVFAHSRIAAEYEKATWELLALTRLTAKEIFIGKWGSTMLVLALLICGALLFYLPVIVIGNDLPTITHQIKNAFFSLMLIVSWAILLVSVGTWTAYRLRRTMPAIALVYAFQVVVLLLVPLLFAIFGVEPDGVAQSIYGGTSIEQVTVGHLSTQLNFWWFGIQTMEIVYWLNPFHALFRFADSLSSFWNAPYVPQNGWLWVQSIVYLTVSFLLLRSTYRRLRREWRKN